MDHLDLNLGPLGDEIRPRFYGNLFENGEPNFHTFHSFPERHGYIWNGKSGFIVTGKGVQVVDFNKFLQSWLFFGLMSTILQDKEWRAGDFIDDQNKIKTNDLLGPEGYLAQWEKREDENRDGQAFRMIRVQIALDTARDVVRMYCSSDPKSKPASPMNVNEKLSLSLMVLGETLTNAKCRIVERVAFNIRGWHGDANEGWGTPSLVVTLMKDSGWCPNTIHMLRGQLGSNATSMLSVYKSHVLPRFHGHDKCKIGECIVKSVEDDGETYQTKHHPNCPDFNGLNKGSCPSIGPEVEEVVKIIERGNIPLLEYCKERADGQDKWEIKVVAYTPFQSYATISHVWADGFGNPEANKLWKCQLDFFQTLFEAADPKRKLKRSPLFWIDTLAIPVDENLKPARKLAIQKIHDIYTKAKYTIVIDNGLTKMSSGSTYGDTAMKILASGWMRRLWTLQEAYLSKRLLFAFADDELRDIDDLEDMYPQANHVLTSNIPTAARSYFHNLLGPDRKARINETPPATGYGLLASVWRAAQWRTTSHAEHETLALATLLNVDYQNKSISKARTLPEAVDAETQTATTKKIRKTPEKELQDMMKDLWTLLEETCPGSIPPGIIFLSGQRLSIPGFGWAPRTWMSGQEVDYPDPLSNMMTAAKLVPGKGLLVQYTGFLLHSKSPKSILWPDGQAIKFPTDSTLLEWYEMNIADKDSVHQQQGTYSERYSQLAIILCRPKPREIFEIALLVGIGRTIVQRGFGGQQSSKIYETQIICRIRIKREGEFKELENLKSFITESEKKEDQFICGEALDSNQMWYVDGQPDISKVLEEENSSLVENQPVVENPSAAEIPPVAVPAMTQVINPELRRQWTGRFSRLLPTVRREAPPAASGVVPPPISTNGESSGLPNGQPISPLGRSRTEGVLGSSRFSFRR